MKTAFSAFVYGSYERFIPFYIYSINKTYPESDIVIFYQGELSESIKKVIKSYPKLIFYDNFYADKLSYKRYKMYGGGGLSLLRFLIPESYFKKYDYVYFGDVDIMILKEDESLFDFHLKQSKCSRVPFSNKVRLLSDGELSKRLTGLHYVEVKPYFEKIQPIMDCILTDENYRNQFLEGVKRDEQFLYKLNKEAFNFNPEELSNNARPWHGFHIGVVRGGLVMSKKQINENSSISFEEIKEQLTQVLKDPKFIKLLKTSFCIEVYWTFMQFEIKLPREVMIFYKYKFIKNRIIKKLINIGNKLS